MQLVESYKDLCGSNGLQIDPSQVQAARALERFTLDAMQGKGRRGFYLWGQVGRGKTMMMDLLYNQVSVPKKRIHFHQLFRELRDQLARESGPNPMHRVAAAIAPAGSFVCIDEMHLSDVDNTLVVELFLSELLRNRLVIVTTSNFSPEQLMPDEIGISRASIESTGEPGPLFLESRNQILRMIEQNFEVFRIAGTEDYRQSRTTGKGAYLHGPLIEKQFSQYTKDLDVGSLVSEELRVFGRPVPVLHRFERALWLDYADICEGRFSYRDYLEILKGIGLVVLEGVDIQTLDGAKRFGWLVEVIYDSATRLILTSKNPIERLFSDVRLPSHLKLEFERVESRLKELTS